METMTKKERRQEALLRHYKALESLGAIHGVKLNGKRISCKLLALEREAHKASEDYCNGVIESERHDEITDDVEKRVFEVLGFEPSGFFVNSDPRGFSLKINDEVMRDLYYNTGLERDWGGYGLLSPEIN